MSKAGATISTPHFTNAGWLGNWIRDSVYISRAKSPVKVGGRFPGEVYKIHAKAAFHDSTFPGCNLPIGGGAVHESYDITLWGEAGDSGDSLFFGDGHSTNTGGARRLFLGESTAGNLRTSASPIRSL